MRYLFAFALIVVVSCSGHSNRGYSIDTTMDSYCQDADRFTGDFDNGTGNNSLWCFWSCKSGTGTNRQLFLVNGVPRSDMTWTCPQ